MYLLSKISDDNNDAFLMVKTTLEVVGWAYCVDFSGHIIDVMFS